MIEFFVHGQAVPQGSKRAIGGNVIEMGGARLRDWRNRCADKCEAHMNGREPLEGPVSVKAIFFVTRPKSHYGTGKNARILKPSVPPAPFTRPDVDKLARSLLDSITGIAFRDDAQVATLTVEKKWVADLGQGAWVSVWPI